MRRNILIALLLLAAASLSLYTLPPSQVSAEVLLQDVPRFDGYRIYFSDSNNEASRFDRSENGISRLGGLLQRLGAELYTLNWNQDIPNEDIDLLIIAGPWNPVNNQQETRLWSYLNEGGRILMLVDPLAFDTRRGFIANPAFRGGQGFFELAWVDIGLTIRNDLISIETGETRMVIPPGDRPRDGEPEPTPLPPVEMDILRFDFATDAIDTDHPITRDIIGPLVFDSARSILFDASIQNYDTQPLVFSDESFYGETRLGDYFNIQIVEYNIGEDIARGPQAIVAAVDDPTDDSRMVIIADREFITNGGGFRTSPSYSAGFLHPENVRFTLNSIAWLAEGDLTDTVELNFPTPGPTVTATPTATFTPSPTPVTPTPTPGADG